VVLRTEDGTLALPPATRKLQREQLAARRRRESRGGGAANSPFRRDLLGCMDKVKGKTIALIRHPAAKKRARPDIVVAPFGVGKGVAQRGWWSIGACCRRKARRLSMSRGAVDLERKRCRDARAKDQGAADDEDDRRFDGN
jgi:hypothetical protein